MASKTNLIFSFTGDHAELRHTIQVHPGSSGYTVTKN